MKAVVAWLIGALTLSVPAAAQEPQAGWFNLPLAGGTRTLAAFGISPQERADTLWIMARVLYGPESGAVTTLAQLSRLLRSATAADAEGGEPADIPAPLTTETWSRLLELQAGDDLSARLLTDRAATLLAFGFSASDKSIRELALRDSDWLRRVYREAPGAFAVAARSLRVERGRVVVPGGPTAERVWEALAGASPARPSAFLFAVLTKDAGRLAWYFDTLAALDQQRLQLAWPEGSPGQRLENARALYETFRAVDGRSRLEDFPFRRMTGDPTLVLQFADLCDGAICGLKEQWFWRAVFAQDDLTREDAARIDRSNTAAVSLTWLTRQIATGDPHARADKFELFRLVQRVFATPRDAERRDMLFALSGYRRYKAVALTLERLRIRDASAWADVVEAARHVDRAGGDRRAALISFQAAVALIARMWHVGSLDTAQAEKSLRSLAVSVRAQSHVPRAIGDWIGATWCCESAILERLAGPQSPVEHAIQIQWEGLAYRLDFAAAEHDRLTGVLVAMPGPAIDAALRSGNEEQIAEALLRIVYATALGDPNGPVSLSSDVATRHDFGMVLKITDEVWPWAPPIEQQGTGHPWHVQGSLIGLDLALARLSMHRLADDEIPEPPTMTLNNYATFARTAVTLAHQDLRDDDRDELVAAIARGRERLVTAQRDLAQLVTLAETVKLRASVRQLLPWIYHHEPHSITGLFSLRDLLWLGQPSLAPERIDRWGMSGQALDARLTLAMPGGIDFESLAGRPDTGQIATLMPDLTLRIAQETARLHLPAALVPAMLAFAVEDFWFDVRVRFSDDVTAMVKQAAALGGERVEDYVAGLTGTGPLRLLEHR